ncbi:MAG TPA: TIGR03620 family F420-dependent LLM class oxidoreductase [Acidimicrobiales bacterium]|nr:TIGR03620 family F420-dependent LLM class oxidoreductase [Acidimicrobiales bacterium]
MVNWSEAALATREHLGKVGLWVPGFATGGRSGAGDLARRAEQLGVSALWVGGGNATAKALDERAAMIDATAHLVVATGIASIWAWPATELEERSAALDAAHPGRFLLGLGVAHAPSVQALGHEYSRPLDKMRAFLDDLDEAAGDDAPQTRVLAALGPAMLALARDRSAGAHPYLVTPEHTSSARRILGPAPVLAPEQAVVVNTDAEAARKIARDYLATYLTLSNYLSNFRRLGFEENDFAAGGSDRLVDALVPWGDAQTVAERVQAHFDAGADHVCIQPLREDRAMDLAGLADVVQALH